MKFIAMPKIRVTRLLVAIVAGVALVACANQMEPAKKMVADVDAAVTAGSADAQKYAPEQATAVNQRLADLHASFDKQDYKTVVMTAPGLLADAKGLAETAAAKKKEAMDALSAQWTTVATTLPATISEIETKVTALSGAKKLPKGVTKDGVAAAKSGLAEIKTAYDEAKAAFGAGDVQGALDKAQGVKAKIAEVSAKLGMPDSAAPAA